jgi:hypothetical protein
MLLERRAASLALGRRLIAPEASYTAASASGRTTAQMAA